MTSPRRPARRLSALSALGLALVVAGLGCLGWLGYQFFGTDVVSDRHFRSETDQLRSSWSRPGTTGNGDGGSGQLSARIPGDAIALLRVPRFGSDFEVPIVQGTTSAALARGVGHYDHTAGPGQVGNFAIAGHRITHGQPFAKMLELNVGDTVEVETRTAIFTYRLDSAPRDLTVDEDAGWVLAPVPGRPEADPTKKLITLTTCQDLFRSPDRSVAFGTLITTRKK